jgi:hypothetical protein
LNSTARSVAKTANTATMTVAAPVTTPAVDLMPCATASSVRIPPSNASRIGLRMKRSTCTGSFICPLASASRRRSAIAARTAGAVTSSALIATDSNAGRTVIEPTIATATTMIVPVETTRTSGCR